MRRCLIILLFVSCWLPARPELEVRFEQANQAYLNEDYPQAIALYEAILHEGYTSPGLTYNLGNAYYRRGEIGQAILYYEKTLKWRPRDANARFNLALANARIKDRIEVPPPFWLIGGYQRIVNRFSATGWAAWITAWLIIGALLWALDRIADWRRVRRAIRAGLILAGLILLLSLPLWTQRYRAENRQEYAILTFASTRCLAAPQEGSTELFIIHEGAKLQLLDREGEWFKIELLDGKQGWIAAAGVGLI